MNLIAVVVGLKKREREREEGEEESSFKEIKTAFSGTFFFKKTFQDFLFNDDDPTLFGAKTTRNFF